MLECALILLSTVHSKVTASRPSKVKYYLIGGARVGSRSVPHGPVGTPYRRVLVVVVVGGGQLRIHRSLALAQSVTNNEAYTQGKDETHLE